MRTLLIDNYDSYTYNLFQVIAEVNGELPLVYCNDKITLEQISAMVQAGTVHSIVISPGPGTPSKSRDIGVCMDLLRELPDVPILGICLGHQALAIAHGALVVGAPEPVHGRLSCLRHSGHGLFKDIPSGGGFEVVRYHSLLVDERSLPHCLEAVCWTTGGHSAVKLARDVRAAGSAAAAPAAAPEAGEWSRSQVDMQQQQQQQQDALETGSGCLLMGLAHRSRPHYGVQFHPESVATRYGIALLRNFRDLAAEHVRRRGGPAAAQLPPARHVADILGPPGRLHNLPPWPSAEHQRDATVRLLWSRLGGLLQQLPGGSQAVFEALYGWASDTFWLDSAAADRGRFSYMGGRGGPLWRKLTYKLPPPLQTLEPTLPASAPNSEPRQPGRARRGELEDGSSRPLTQAPEEQPQYGTAVADPDSDAASNRSSTAGDTSCSSCGPASTTGGSSLFTCINTATASATHTGGAAAASAGGGAAAAGGTLTVETPDGCVSLVAAAPAGFLGHLQGLLERQRLLVEAEAAQALPFNFWGGLVGYLGYELKAECGGAHAHAATTPDAVMYLADRLVACDHATGDVFLLALYDSAGSSGDGCAAGVGGAAGVGDLVSDPEGRALLGREDVERADGSENRPARDAAGADMQKAQAKAWLRATQRALEAVAAAEAATALASGVSEGLPSTAACPPPPCCQGAEASSPAAAALTSAFLACSCGARCAGDAGVGTGSTEISATDQLACPRCSGGRQQLQQQPVGSHTAAGSSTLAARGASCKDGVCSAGPAEAGQPPAPADGGGPVPFTLAHTRSTYLRNIAACHAALHAGESYEVCLTTALVRAAAPCPAQLYRTLRQLNPAPYAAWLQCGTAGPTICCSSPERFLRGDRGGLLEARPIKGTAARVAADSQADAAAAAELASSEKERAENLMIVDLLRNDLGRVCEVGTVHVPGLMDIESYATVHQMVSTVRGVRRTGMSIIDCIRAAFPGGSMTGAPKVRTMQIIDTLEDRARGVYSGSIGFISLNDTFDLNIVIRTAVIEDLGSAPGTHATAGLGSSGAPAGAAAAPLKDSDCQPIPRRVMTIGAGGAIVVQSQPEAEYEEMRLKARALLRAVSLCEGHDGPLPVLTD